MSRYGENILPAGHLYDTSYIDEDIESDDDWNDDDSDLFDDDVDFDEDDDDEDEE